jgi:hypothetical protein
LHTFKAFALADNSGPECFLWWYSSFIISVLCFFFVRFRIHYAAIVLLFSVENRFTAVLLFLRDFER